MLFMVVEHIRDSKAVYNRLREKGRTLPEGLSSGRLPNQDSALKLAFLQPVNGPGF